jgi:hypothetical protein
MAQPMTSPMAVDPTLEAMSRRARLANATFASIAIVLVVVAVAELTFLVPYMDAEKALGADYRFFMDITRHWVVTGEFYLPHQLAGRYQVQTLVDVLYPPIALYLFVPFLVLPAVLWWAIPVTVFAASVAWLRPARWTWPLIAFGVAWPQTLAQLLYGNTNMWVAAMIAAGVVLAWPSVMILFKPAFAPFALIGIKRRRWWVAMGILCLAAVPFGTMWLDYATVIRHSSLSASYGLINLPLMVAPLIAWMGRRRPERTVHLEVNAPAEAVPDVDDFATGKIE